MKQTNFDGIKTLESRLTIKLSNFKNFKLPGKLVKQLRAINKLANRFPSKYVNNLKIGVDEQLAGIYEFKVSWEEADFGRSKTKSEKFIYDDNSRKFFGTHLRRGNPIEYSPQSLDEKLTRYMGHKEILGKQSDEAVS